jgi:hypothetical protein
MITLIAKEVVYFSQGDEDAFFAWLNRIGAVSGSRGVGNELLITIKDGAISDLDLRELIGLFHRYNIDKKQLGQFITEKNSSWFRGNLSAFWHSEIFG